MMRYMRTFIVTCIVMSLMAVMAMHTVQFWFPGVEGNPRPKGWTKALVPFGLLSAIALVPMQAPAVFVIKNGFGVSPEHLPLRGFPVVVPMTAAWITGIHALFCTVRRKKRTSNNTSEGIRQPADGLPKPSR